ncbi:MAG: ATP-dependent Clp protease ATP-binding subunit [Deltaproteobacteria bacterium]|nr:ATP-dependent Clp protease ATP-binding subunit [Deltaproteobacteria bacterium]
MSFLVTVHERRVGAGQIAWTTLGLGAATIDETGGSVSLLKERFVQRLKAWVKRAKTRELLRLEQLPGIALEHHRVTLEIGRLTRTLSAPLVLERRHTGAASATGDVLQIGYHPLAQGDFFIVDPTRSIADQYRIFLEHLRRDVTEAEDLDDLEVRKDRLRTLVFDADVPSLLDRVGPARGAWWKDLQPERRDEGEAPASELDAIATDLTERATEGALALGLPRDSLAARLSTLAARGPVVLVGPPGVGKTTLVHRWVDERLRDDGYGVHRSLDQVRRVWSLSGRRILAGMKHHGDWEARVARVIDELHKRKGHLVVPDLPQWAQLGRTRDSDRNLADVMRGPLERREVLIVGEATAEAWARLEERAPAFASQFQVLAVPEPEPDDLVRMLLAAARVHEDDDIVFDPDAFGIVRDWSAVLYPGRAEPGRSIALLGEASRIDSYVGSYELIEAMTERAGVPGDLLTHRTSVPDYVPEELEALRRHVVGQDEATGAMVDLLQRIRTGLVDPARPWGVFLLTGPTGTGKTELAKGLADTLYGSDKRLLRIDANQLVGPDAVARLIGDSWAPDGRLTGPILDTPFQVVLIDELDKAHPSVLYLLLQLLDEGRLTDAAGRTADFRRAVILITSNLGAAAQRAPLGFGDAPDAATRRADTTRAVAAALPPELFNRLDAVLAFQPLAREVARTIAERQVGRLADRAGLRDRFGSLTCTARALDVIVRHGFDPEYGARTVKRWIESHVTDRIAAELVTLPGDGMKRVTLDAHGDALTIAIETLAAAPKTLAQPWTWLLDFSPGDCDAALDRTIAELAALFPRDAGARDHEAGPVVIAPEGADAADRLYWRERLRGAVADTLKALRRTRSMKRSAVRDIVALLSEASFLARVAARVDEPINQVTVRLSRPTRARAWRLFPALRAALSTAPWEVEAAAHLDVSGVARKGPGEVVDRVALRLTGLGVALALAPEVGAHVLDTMGEGLEVVTLELVDDGGRPLTDVVREGGTRLGEQVRTLRHEGHKSEARPYEVEDHRMGHHERGHIVQLAQLVGWCQALARGAGPVAPPAAAEAGA